jgi:hypothetical protein
VPESIIAGEVANRQKGIYQQISAMEARKEAYIADYNRLTEVLNNRFKVYQTEQDRKMNFLSAIY